MPLKIVSSATVVAYHMDQGCVQIADEEVEIIRGKVAAANQQVDFWQPAFHRVVVKLRLYVIGNGKEFDCARLVQFSSRWSLVGN